ncbi:MAG: LptF/LptG family permease [Rhodobacteraceae bacterium]|nr:LptF/LptG family permease [Paracoccaceae bacterium]
MLNRLDRYFIAQLLAPFGFFSLVIIGILWLAQALPLVDKVIESGQSGLVFLEVTSLLIPRVMMVALPFSAFGAALYALNRLYSEAELVVMMTSGQSPLALAKPVAIFGIIVMLLMVVTTFYLVPASQAKLHTRMNEIQTELAGSLIREGQFIHPTDKITIFVRDTSRDGEMAGMFLYDQTDPNNPVTYSAQKSLLLQDGYAMRIVMIDGIILQYSKSDSILNTIRFDRFSYDLGDVLPSATDHQRGPFEMFPHELLFPTQADLDKGGWSLGDFYAEGHHKVAMPISALALPLIALGVIVLGGFRRGGFMRRVMFAIGIGVLLQSSVIVAKSYILNAPEMYWTMYMPATTGLSLSLYLLYRAGRTRRPRAWSRA